MGSGAVNLRRQPVCRDFRRQFCVRAFRKEERAFPGGPAYFFAARRIAFCSSPATRRAVASSSSGTVRFGRA